MELLPLFSRLLLESGTLNYDEISSQTRIDTYTGGISSHMLNEQITNSGKVSDVNNSIFYLVISGKCTNDNTKKLFEIVYDLIMNAKLDNNNLAIKLSKEFKVSKESSFISEGHILGSIRLSSKYSLSGYFNEKTSGISYAKKLSDLIDLAKEKWDLLLFRLERIKHILINKNNLIINLTTEKSKMTDAFLEANNFLNLLPNVIENYENGFISSWNSTKLSPSNHEAFIIPTQV